MDAIQTSNSTPARPELLRLLDLLSASSNEEFKTFANHEKARAVGKDAENHAVERIVSEFYNRKHDQSGEFDDEIKAFMAEAKAYFDQTASAAANAISETVPPGDESSSSSLQAERGPASTATPAKAPTDAEQLELARYFEALQRRRESAVTAPEEQRSEQAMQRSGPITLDVFGSLWTSFGSFFNANKRAASAAASYVADQASVEFGRDVRATAPVRSLFGGGDKGDDFSRHEAALEGLDLAGRRLEDGRPVNMDAVQRHLEYLRTSMDGAKDSDLRVNDLDRMKMTQDALDEFSERAGKSTQTDPEEQKRLEEIVKMAQDIGRMISAFVSRIAGRFKSMVGLSGQDEGGSESSASARPRM